MRHTRSSAKASKGSKAIRKFIEGREGNGSEDINVEDIGWSGEGANYRIAPSSHGANPLLAPHNIAINTATDHSTISE
jgi:hypothetical protein